jgi:hypothetical protein
MEYSHLEAVVVVKRDGGKWVIKKTTFVSFRYENKDHLDETFFWSEFR